MAKSKWSFDIEDGACKTTDEFVDNVIRVAIQRAYEAFKTEGYQKGDAWNLAKQCVSLAASKVVETDTQFDKTGMHAARKTGKKS